MIYMPVGHKPKKKINHKIVPKQIVTIFFPTIWRFMNKVEDNPLEEIFYTDYLCQRSLEINPS
jgi:hypothetical protein